MANGMNQLLQVLLSLQQQRQQQAMQQQGGGFLPTQAAPSGPSFFDIAKQGMAQNMLGGPAPVSSNTQGIANQGAMLQNQQLGQVNQSLDQTSIMQRIMDAAKRNLLQGTGGAETVSPGFRKDGTPTININTAPLTTQERAAKEQFANPDYLQNKQKLANEKELQLFKEGAGKRELESMKGDPQYRIKVFNDTYDRLLAEGALATATGAPSITREQFLLDCEKFFTGPGEAVAAIEQQNAQVGQATQPGMPFGFPMQALPGVPGGNYAGAQATNALIKMFEKIRAKNKASGSSGADFDVDEAASIIGG